MDIVLESRLMPRNNEEVAGPSIFAGATGRPRRWQRGMAMLRAP